MKLDINSDMGEGFGRWTVGDDAGMMKVVSSANIACGYHAGDHDIMAACVSAALKQGVAIGAHPGFRDLIGFGRRNMPTNPDEMKNMLVYQIGALQGVATALGHKVTHVSYHAAFGNTVLADPDLSDALAGQIRRMDPDLIIYSQPGTVVEKSARRAGLRVMTLFLADRAFLPDGALVPRGQPGAVITDHDQIAERVSRFVQDGSVVCSDGSVLKYPAKGILVHSDTPGSTELARIVRETVTSLGVTVAPSTEIAD
ncbi:MAG: LamB/YcsF family protein [Pseudorhodobacter sp.]